MNFLFSSWVSRGSVSDCLPMELLLWHLFVVVSSCEFLYGRVLWGLIFCFAFLSWGDNDLGALPSPILGRGRPLQEILGSSTRDYFCFRGCTFLYEGTGLLSLSISELVPISSLVPKLYVQEEDVRIIYGACL